MASVVIQPEQGPVDVFKRLVWFQKEIPIDIGPGDLSPSDIEVGDHEFPTGNFEFALKMVGVGSVCSSHGPSLLGVPVVVVDLLHFRAVVAVTWPVHQKALQATLVNMGNSQQSVPIGWHRFAIYGGWVATFVLAAWMVIPRLLIGTTATISWVMIVLLPIVLIGVGCVTLGVPTSRGLVPTKRSVGWLWFSFLGAFIVGLFLPDGTIFSAGAHNQATALVAVLFGTGWEGAGPAIANPAAIIMTISGIIAAVFSVLDSREGGPIRTEDEDHFQGQGYFGILGEDEYYQR